MHDSKIPTRNVQFTKPHACTQGTVGSILPYDEIVRTAYTHLMIRALSHAIARLALPSPLSEFLFFGSSKATGCWRHAT